jgi:hypothetical protein
VFLSEFDHIRPLRSLNYISAYHSRLVSCVFVTLVATIINGNTLALASAAHSHDNGRREGSRVYSQM